MADFIIMGKYALNLNLSEVKSLIFILNKLKESPELLRCQVNSQIHHDIVAMRDAIDAEKEEFLKKFE
jgi:hypothetical protein